MERTLPALRPLAIPYWRETLLAGYVALNLAVILLRVRPGPERVDWQLFLSLPDRLAAGSLYLPGDAGWWAWSPVVAWLMVGVTWVGYWPWLAAHVAVLALLRDWRLIALALVSWSFWVDAVQGHHMVFVAVAGILAVRGSRPATYAYLALFLLAPRPLELPLAVFLLWRDRSLWLPFAAMTTAHMLVVLVTGYGDDWAAAMLRPIPGSWNLGPGQFLGLWWLLAGIPLGVWLYRRGWLGAAGWAVSHYVLPQYLLIGLVDVDRWLRRSATA